MQKKSRDTNFSRCLNTLLREKSIIFLAFLTQNNLALRKGGFFINLQKHLERGWMPPLSIFLEYFFLAAFNLRCNIFLCRLDKRTWLDLLTTNMKRVIISLQK